MMNLTIMKYILTIVVDRWTIMENFHHQQQIQLFESSCYTWD
jgi:hypothetical protein